MSSPKSSSFTFPSFQEMAIAIPDGRATHYKYRKETSLRKRPKEGGKLFELDADEDEVDAWPKARKGAWVIDLFLQRLDSDGRGVIDASGQPDVEPIDFSPGNPGIVLRVDLAGRAPAPTAATEPPSKDVVHLEDLRHAHDTIRQQRDWMNKDNRRLRKELKQERKKKKKWRRQAREAEEGNFLAQLLRGARDNPTGSAKALKEIAPIVVDAATGVYDHVVSRKKSTGKRDIHNENEPIDVNPSPDSKS